MNNSSGISYIRGDNAATQAIGAENSQHIKAISDIIVRDLSAMLQGMFDGIDDSFFELANHAHSNNEQNRFFEAMREIRIKRKGIENEFREDISKRFLIESVLTGDNTEPTEHNEFSTLSLVQNDDLEEEVAIASMATKASANFQGPLLQFHTRLANLYQADKLDSIAPPLSPKEISQAFAHACACLEIEIKEKLIVLKQFDRYVLSNLGILLEDANKRLISIGIIPNFKNQGYNNSGQLGKKSQTDSKLKNEQSPVTSKSTSDYEGIPKAPNSPSVSNVLPQLQTLLANVRSHNPNSLAQTSYNNYIPSNSETRFVSTTDLINLLSAIQGSSAESQTSEQLIDNPKVVNIHQELKNRFSSDSSTSPIYPTYKQIDEDVINLVAMLFEFILEDYNLSPAVQVLIGRLQIPVLKVVIKDNNFFSSNKHPARKLLNLIAKSGVSCNESSKKDRLFEKLESIVNTLVSEYNGEISIFEKLYMELSSFLEKEEKKSKIVEQRTKESEIGLIKSRLAQKEVEETLNILLSDSTIQLPNIVSDTLLGGWSRVMFLAKLKDEQEHQWSKTCSIAEELVWCFQPFNSPKDKQRWIAIAPKVLKNLRTGLEEVSYNASDLDETLAEVRSYLTNTFKRNSLNLNQVDANNIALERVAKEDKADQRSAIEIQRAKLNAELEKYAYELDDLKLGTWIEFIKDGQKTRCKLSAIVEESNSFIFVNRVGLKAREVNKLDLAKMLTSGNAFKLNQGPLIDRALNALTSNLKQKASA